MFTAGILGWLGVSSYALSLFGAVVLGSFVYEGRQFGPGGRLVGYVTTVLALLSISLLIVAGSYR